MRDLSSQGLTRLGEKKRVADIKHTSTFINLLEVHRHEPSISFPCRSMKYLLKMFVFLISLVRYVIHNI